jgi:eukaryotic-like serine/threonine-protein kinase
MATVHRRTIGRYEILGELGRGMMGVVYEAHDPALGRTIALKTINPTYVAGPADREEFERRFVAEARTAGRLSHPGIVVVHDVGRDEEDGLLFIAFERLSGAPLATVFGRGTRLPWRESLAITRQVAEALQHAHEQGVIHRDVKPANIMLLPSGQPKVMDFGIAKVEAAHLTAAGQFFGTPLYMSPEQALSQKVDARTDVFSLGAVAYALLTGRQDFEGESVVKILGRVVYQDPLPPTSLDATLPADVDYLLARALAKNPDDRYREARELAGDIEDILDGRPPRHRAGWTPPPPIPHTDIEPTLVAALGPGAFMPTITVGPGFGSGELAPPLPAVLRARPRGILRLPARTLALLGALLLALAGLASSRGWFSPAPHPQTPPSLSPEAPPPAALAPSPAPSILPAVPEPKAAADSVPPPARVVVDVEHPLESGRLRMWLDDEELLVDRLKGEVTTNLVLFKLRSGVLTEVLDLGPGRHRFRVEVSWNDQVRTEEIPARFLPGETYRLEVRLGRMKKDLSLRWTR